MIYFIIMIVFSPFTAIIPAIYSLNLLLRKRLKIEINYWNIGLGLMYICATISAIVNKSILSFLASLGILICLSFSIFLQNYFVKINRITRVLKYIVYITNISAIAGIIEKMVFLGLGDDKHRIYSSFGNPNMTGAWFGTIILIIFYLKSIAKNKKEILTYNISMVLAIISLLLTESTGAFIALIGSMFVYYFLKEKKDLKSLIGLTISTGAIALIFIGIQNKVANITPIGEIVTSFNSRYRIWTGSLKMIAEKPICGWGLLGSMERGSNYIYSDRPDLHNKIISFLIHPHNIWLAFLVAMGIIGIIIYLYIKFNLYKDMIKLYKNHNKMLPLIASINSMVIIQGIVDCTLYAPQLAIIFLGIGIITYNMANEKMIKKVKVNKFKSTDKQKNNIAI